MHCEAWFLSGDAHHITHPQHDGRGTILAMKQALEHVQNHFPFCHFVLHILEIVLYPNLKLESALDCFKHIHLQFPRPLPQWFSIESSAN
jgi:hypothetical protein